MTRADAGRAGQLLTNRRMNGLSTVLLKPGEGDRVVAGHPWIYHSSILRLTQPAADGDVVQVKDHRQRGGYDEPVHRPPACDVRVAAAVLVRP